MACLIIPFAVAKQQYLMKKSFSDLLRIASKQSQKSLSGLPDDIEFKPERNLVPLLPDDILFGQFDHISPLPDSIVKNLPDDLKPTTPGMKSFQDLCRDNVIDFNAYKQALEKGNK